jgi:hypothetical protein
MHDHFEKIGDQQPSTQWLVVDDWMFSFISTGAILFFMLCWLFDHLAESISLLPHLFEWNIHGLLFILISTYFIFHVELAVRSLRVVYISASTFVRVKYPWLAFLCLFRLKSGKCLYSNTVS